MSSTENNPVPPCDKAEWVSDTALFKRAQSLRREIDLHKWYESEKAGYDIGLARASTSWLIHHCSGQ